MRTRFRPSITAVLAPALPAVLAIALSALLARPGVAVAAPIAFHDGDGIHVVSAQRLDPRLLALTVTSATLPAPANVRVLLPVGYGRQQRRHRRYPVLYLLHGTSGSAADWTTVGGAEQTTGERQLIVVMPDIGLGGNGGGWCSDWWNAGARGVPEWETFHIDELLPWIDRNLRTIRSRRGRAIAGLSQGGFCSLSYAARHPDLFGTALAYSGAPDIAYDAQAQALVTPVINATETALDGAAPNSIFGPRMSEEINWAARDPTTLAQNLADTKLLMYTGNGIPGPLDATPPSSLSLAIEAGVHQLTQLFHARLQALAIPSFYEDYGPGTHSWPYWARDLRESIDAVMHDFAHPDRVPSRVTFTSADPSYAVYGWRVAVHRAVAEFSTLAGAGRGGFTLSGSGAATVATPPVYRRGRRYAISITSPSGRRVLRERAGRDRRLVISVPLGRSNTVQEYPFDGSAASTRVYRTAVTISRR